MVRAAENPVKQDSFLINERYFDGWKLTGNVFV